MTLSNRQTSTKRMATKRSSKKTAKHKPLRLTYHVRTPEEYMMYAGTDATQGLVFRVALDAIKYGIAEGKDSVDIFLMDGDEQANNHYSMDRTEWKKALASAIKYYAQKEQYEVCIDCQQLINSL